MKKIALNIIVFLLGFFYANAQFTDLIISEYSEGNGFNKYIEIYNGTGFPVDLSNYEIWVIFNDGSWPEATISLSGTLADGDIYVVANPNASATILGVADFTSNNINWNGNDAVGLVRSATSTIIDQIGEQVTGTPSNWNVAGITGAGANRTLVRKDNVCTGNSPNWTASAGTNATNSEWIVSAVINDWTDLGVHTEFCSSTDTFVSFTTASSSITEDGVTIDVCVSILNPSITNPTSVDIELNTSSTATNGIDYDDGAGTPMAIPFPVTLTFPANTSTDQCLSFFISNDDLIYEGDELVILDLNNATGGTAASIGFNSQHILTITDNEAPVDADVIITEIMYNPQGADDEWIEICNTNTIPQVLNNYSIEVNNVQEFIFPASGAVIDPGECITIALGDDGDAEFNDANGTLGYCPFTPNYGSPTDTNNLGNSPVARTIELITDGLTVVDDVTYTAFTDGAFQNGASLHVIDDSQDNSNTSVNWQEVFDGGSPGFNTLISQCSSLQPEINVEGNINAFNDIPDGDTTPNFFDNTLFSTIEVATSEAKSFRIQNIGTATLNVSNIEIVGTDPGDFAVTSPAVLAFTVDDISTGNNVEIFEITFTPTAVGERNATVRITNDDPTDGENIYEFAIQGNAFCTGASNTLTPLTGPDLTVVTIIGADLNGSTSVEFAGSTIPHTVVSPTEIEITIPDSSTSGNIVVTNNIGCQTTDLFTVIVNDITGCQGNLGLNPTDLFISEVTDAPTGQHSYIEIFNGTGAAVDLEDYELRIHNNGSNNAGGAIADLTGIVADGATYVIGIGGADATLPLGGVSTDATFGISGINSNDNVRLYFDDGVTETWLDVWGDTSGSDFTASPAGYTYRRKNTGIPDPPRIETWGAPDNMENDWTVVNFADYTDVGNFTFSNGTPPTITTDPSLSVTSCELTASANVVATEGFADSVPLTYQWYAIAPGATSWSALTPSAVYSGVTTSVLNISDTIGLDNYQYYCQVREDGNTCFTASNAIRLETQSTIWESPGAWSNGAPDINTITVLDFDYDTNSNGNIDACTLFINAASTLTISNNTYVQVDGDLTVNGNIVQNPYGSFVQIDDLGLVSGSDIVVEKRTAILNTPQEYTYWSSPVSGETIGNGLNESAPARRFLFNAQNYRDSQQESMNDNSSSPGQDDIDDNGDDWQLVSNPSTIMAAGVGYAATHSVIGFSGPGNQYTYTFEGSYNNGVINTPVYRNEAENLDNNWNFIGNPYPSAISVDDFFTQNVYDGTTNPTGALNGSVYLWSHNTAASNTNNGNEAYNYAQSDYAIINGIGETAGGDGIVPDRFIPSGQGFFVTMANSPAPGTAVTATIRTADVEFNNSMRDTGNNSQFFRTSQALIPNKLRIDLTSDNGVFNQIFVGYVEGATDQYDGMYYDATRNLSTGTSTILYTIIDESDKKFAIQGRDPSSLDIDETIHLGFFTTISEATLYSIEISDLEGEFMTSNTIYLKDNLLGIYHNLSEGNYSFTSNTGDFLERFEIVFQAETLSTSEHIIEASDLIILELNTSEVKFSVNSKVSITNIEIYDLLGRTLYSIDAKDSNVVANLDNLSQSVYIAKVSLSNGQTITKRSIKRL